MCIRDSVSTTPTIENSHKKLKPDPKDLELTDNEKLEITAQVTAYLTSEHPEITIKPEDIINLIQQIRSSTDKISLAKACMEDFKILSQILQEIKPLVRASIKTTITSFLKVISSKPADTAKISDSDTDKKKLILHKKNKMDHIISWNLNSAPP